jgi:hypothetical protein
VAKDAIQNGTAVNGADGSVIYHTTENNVTVVANANGRVITVGYGRCNPR